MDRRQQEHLAENEVRFRQLNQRIKAAAMRFEDGHARDQLYEMLCECAQHKCRELLAVRLSEYEGVRSEQTRFLVLPHHVEPGLEQVVERYDRFWIVEKVGPAADVAKQDGSESAADSDPAP